MMKNQNTASAKRKRFITNTIVHVILAVLAVIWVIPIAWIIMISFRGESGQYISTLILHSLFCQYHTVCHVCVLR